MKRRRTALVALSASLMVFAAASCGRYGKPVRSQPPPEPAEHAQTIEKR